MNKKKIVIILLYFLAAAQTIGTFKREIDSDILTNVLNSVDHIFFLAGSFNFFVPASELWSGKVKFLAVEKRVGESNSENFLISEFSRGAQSHFGLMPSWMDPDLNRRDTLEIRSSNLLKIIGRKNPMASEISILLYEMSTAEIGKTGDIKYNVVQKWPDVKN